MDDVTRFVAPWVHLVLDHMVGFVGLLFFSFFGLLGALAKFRVRILPYLVGATVVWGVLGFVAIGGGIKPLSLGGIITPQREAWLSLEFAKRATFAWLAGTTIGVGLILITVLFEKYTKSRTVRLATLLVRSAVFVAAFLTYLRIYVIRG